MKSLRKLLLTIFFFSISMFMVQVLADTPPGPPGGGHGTGGNQPPGGQGAPIDNGTGILMALGACYGTWKLYKSRKTGFNTDELTSQ